MRNVAKAGYKVQLTHFHSTCLLLVADALYVIAGHLRDRRRSCCGQA